jgi:hypothetical protein
MTTHPKTVRIPDRLWPGINRVAREELRTPSEAVRSLIERSLLQRQFGQAQQGDVAQRSVKGGHDADC